MKEIKEEKNLSDLCINISEGLEHADNIYTNWRHIMKFAQDFLSDNGLELELKRKDKNV